MSRRPDQVLDYLIQLSDLSNQVLADKQALIDLDRERNLNREAMSKISKITKNNKNDSNQKFYCSFGNTFLKLSDKELMKQMEADQIEINEKSEKIRNGLKDKVAKLKEAEGDELNSGFHLKPVVK